MKVVLFIKMMENYSGVPIHLKIIVLNRISIGLSNNTPVRAIA